MIHDGKYYNIEEAHFVDDCKTFADERGYFTTLPGVIFGNVNYNTWVPQENVSVSKPGVLRGMHYQKHHPQAKLVKVLYGRVLDVVVDIRPWSPTFKKATSFLLFDAGAMLYIPRGYAHGFLNIGETDAVFHYKIDDEYHPEDECGIRWDSIDFIWPIEDKQKLIISEKDAKWPKLEDVYFKCK